MFNRTFGILRAHWRANASGACCAFALLLSGASHAQNAERGAALYLRLENDSRSCASCHGPDPGQSRNNILRAADSPDTLTKVLNTVSAMGFLRAQLTEADRADITAYLGSVVEMNKADSPLHVWPATLDFGAVAPGARGSEQFLRISNRSATQSIALTSAQSTQAAFDVRSDCPSLLLPGQSCDLTMRLAPQAQGLLGGALVVKSPDLARPRLAGALGYGAPQPVSALRWEGLANLLRFGASGTSSSMVQQSLKLENPGPMPAVLGTASITGPQASQFRLESGCAAGQVLQAGTSCTLVIGYTAGRVPAQAALQMRSDQGNPQGLRLEGLPLTEQPVVPDVAQSGGGCSIGPPANRGRWDPLLPLLVFVAALAWRGRRRTRRSPMVMAIRGLRVGSA